MAGSYLNKRRRCIIAVYSCCVCVHSKEYQMATTTYSECLFMKKFFPISICRTLRTIWRAVIQLMCHLYHDERSQQQKQQQQQPVMSENIHREVKKMSRISVLSDIEYKPPPTPALESYKHKKFHRHDRDDLSDCQSEHKGDDSSAASHSSSSSSKSPPASASQHQRLSSTSSNDEPASQNNNILIKQESPSPPMAPVAAQVAAVVAASNLGVLRPNMSSHTRPTFGSEASSFRRVSPSSGSNPHTRGPDFIPPGMAVAAAAAAQYNGVGHYPFYNLNPPPHGPYPLVNLPPHLQPHATALHNPHHPLHVTAPPQHRLALGANAGPAPHHRLHANPFSPSTHTLQLLQQQGTSLERIPEIVSNVPPYPFSSSRNSPSPSISSRSSIDGGAMSGLDGSGGPNRITCSGSRKRKKQEDIPDWVKVSDFVFCSTVTTIVVTMSDYCFMLPGG